MKTRDWMALKAKLTLPMALCMVTLSAGLPQRRQSSGKIKRKSTDALTGKRGCRRNVGCASNFKTPDYKKNQLATPQSG